MIFLAPFAKSRMLLYLGLVHLGYTSVGPFFRTFFTVVTLFNVVLFLRGIVCHM